MSPGSQLYPGATRSSCSHASRRVGSRHGTLLLSLSRYLDPVLFPFFSLADLVKVGVDDARVEVLFGFPRTLLRRVAVPFDEEHPRLPVSFQTMRYNVIDDMV